MAHAREGVKEQFVMFRGFNRLFVQETSTKTLHYSRHSSSRSSSSIIRASSSNRGHAERPSEDTASHRRKYSQWVPRLTGFQALPHLHGGHPCETVRGLSGWRRSLVCQRRQSATLWGPQDTALPAAATTPPAEPLHPFVVIV